MGRRPSNIATWTEACGVTSLDGASDSPAEGWVREIERRAREVKAGTVINGMENRHGTQRESIGKRSRKKSKIGFVIISPMAPILPSNDPVKTAFHFPRLDNPWNFALASCFLLTVLLGARFITDFDLGYHLRGGQWMLQNHRFFTKDVYTYTVSDHDYLDIHWFYQILLYLAFKLGGYAVLSVLNTLLIFLVFILTYLRLRLTGAPLWMRVVLLEATLLACETRFQVRPEILSWALMSLVLLILEWREKRERDLLFLLPLLQLLWANMEGLFAIGLVLMGVYVLQEFFLSPQRDWKLLKYSAFSAAACLINPNFLRGFLFPITHLLTLASANVFTKNIGEFKSPWSMGAGDISLFTPGLYLGVYKTFSFFLLFLVLAAFKNWKTRELLLAGAFFYLSMTAVRNVSLFMLAVAPLAATHWKELQWVRLRRLQQAVFSRPAAAWAFSLFTLLFCLRVATNAYYISDRRQDRVGLGLDTEKQPVHAAQFLVDNQLDGRILNHLNAGGWLVWKGPQKVFIDGRLEVMERDFFTEYEDSLEPDGLEKLVAKYRPDILFFNPQAAAFWILELRKMPDWRLVYLDEYFAIFLRKGYAPQVGELDQGRLLQEKGVPKPAPGGAPILLGPPYPPAFKNWLEGFYRPQAYPDGLLNMATFYFESGEPQPAEAILLEAIRLTEKKYFDLYLNLGSLYFYTGRYGESRLCAERVLADSPRNPIALKILSQLP